MHVGESLHRLHVSLSRINLQASEGKEKDSLFLSHWYVRYTVIFQRVIILINSKSEVKILG